MTQKSAFRTAFLIAFIALLSNIHPASASDVDILINKLVERNILTRIDADSIRAEIESEKIKTPSGNPWLEGLSQKGDVRLRYEVISQENEDARDRERGRFRLRWGLEKKFNDEWKAGFRLASGSTTEATANNQSFDDEFNLKSVFIDRAYGLWTPTEGVRSVLPAVSNAEFGGGKVANPYEKWGTSIVWDPDVNPEGVYEKADFKIGKLEVSALLGQFVLNENSTGQDSTLFAYGAGTNVAWDKAHNWQTNFVYYDWHNYEDLIKSGSVLTATNPAGNDTEVDSFKVLSIYSEVNFPVPTLWGDQNLKLFGHYIHNTDEGEDVNGNPETPNGHNDDGAAAGVQIGKSKSKGEWEAKYQYFYIEPNATPGNFTESDLGLGFANNAGHQLQAAYRILDNLQFLATISFAERPNRTAAGQDQDRQITRFNADLMYSF